MSRTRTLSVTLAAALTALTGCGQTSTQAESGGGPAIVEIAPNDRVAVDDFRARLLDGADVTASRLDDTVTVVNVWGSWCGPCRVEAPALRQVSRQYARRGVRFLGLNVRDNDSAALAFDERFDIPYDSVTSSDSPRVSLAFGGALTTAAVPMTVVVDRQRRVAARVIGVVTGATLRALLDSVLAESADHGGGGGSREAPLAFYHR